MGFRSSTRILCALNIAEHQFLHQSQITRLSVFEGFKGVFRRDFYHLRVNAVNGPNKEWNILIYWIHLWFNMMEKSYFFPRLKFK